MRARGPQRLGYTRGFLPALVFLVGVAVGAAGLHVSLPYLASIESSQPPATTASTKPPPLVANGRLEPLGHIVSVYGPPGDRVEKLKVDVGDEVELKQPLILLGSRPDREAERALAQRQYDESVRLWHAIRNAGNAKIAEIEAEIRQATAGRKEDTEALDKQVEVRQLKLAQAQREFSRLKKLTQASVSDQEREQHELGIEQLKADLFVAQMQRAKSEANYEHGEKVAHAKLKAAELEIGQNLERVPWLSAQQSLRLADRRFAATEFESIQGEVLRVLTPEGDTILAPQAILQIANVKKMAVVAEVSVEQVEKLRAMLAAGPVPVRAHNRDVLREKSLTGELKSDGLKQRGISTVVGPSNFKPGFPGESKDRRIVEVRIPLDDESAATARKYLDLEVKVHFGNPSSD